LESRYSLGRATPLILLRVNSLDRRPKMPVVVPRTIAGIISYNKPALPFINAAFKF